MHAQVCVCVCFTHACVDIIMSTLGPAMQKHLLGLKESINIFASLSYWGK